MQHETNITSEEHISNDNSINKNIWKSSIPQILACCAVHSLVIQVGIHMTYSAILLPTLSSNDSSIPINIDEGSWIASLATITTPIGSLITGPLMDYFGRKHVCLFTTFPFLASSLFLILANNVWSIYVGRMLAGFASGLSSAALVYVSEVAHPLMRPMLLCLNSVFVSFGILTVCILSLWLTWKTMAACFAILIVFSFFCIFTLPESPEWLLSKYLKTGIPKYKKLFEKSVSHFQSQKELREMEMARLLDNSSIQSQQSMVHKHNFWEDYKDLSTIKPISLLFCLFFFQQLSGTYVVIFYAVDIFRNIGGDFGAGIDEYSALVMLGAIRFFMSGVTAFCSQICGRRKLCIISGSCMALMSFIVSVYLHISLLTTESITEISRYQWLPLCGVLLYVCSSALGYLVIPWTLIGELLPLKIRGTGSGLMISIAYVIMFTIIKSFPYILRSVGIIAIFYFFSILSLSGVCFVYIFIPETLGKSLEEIQEYFK